MNQPIATENVALSEATVREVVACYLQQQGFRADVACVLSKVVMQHVLTWQEEPANPDTGNAIIAFSFGYRREDDGYKAPGPVNQALADLAVQHYWRKPRPVYAHSSIADLIKDRLPNEDLKPIAPRIKTPWWSTRAMLEVVLNQVQDPRKHDPWLIIAHRHHAERCAITARYLGFSVIVPRELPDRYDRACVHPWKRWQLPYVINDIIARLELYSNDVVLPVIRRVATLKKKAKAEPHTNQDNPESVQGADNTENTTPPATSETEMEPTCAGSDVPTKEIPTPKSLPGNKDVDEQAGNDPSRAAAEILKRFSRAQIHQTNARWDIDLSAALAVSASNG